MRFTFRFSTLFLLNIHPVSKLFSYGVVKGFKFLNSERKSAIFDDNFFFNQIVQQQYAPKFDRICNLERKESEPGFKQTFTTSVQKVDSGFVNWWTGLCH